MGNKKDQDNSGQLQSYGKIMKNKTDDQELKVRDRINKAQHRAQRTTMAEVSSK